MTDQLFDDLPEWLDAELWREFLEMRKSKKAPATEYAQKRLLRKLERFHVRGLPVNDMLERSYLNGWKDIYERDEDTRANGIVDTLIRNGGRLDLPGDRSN